MSLRLLLPEHGVTDLLADWPDEVRVYDRPLTALDDHLDAASLFDLLDTGCAPAAEVAAIKAPNPSLNPASFSTNGRTDPVRLRKLYDNGHTIRIGNLQRVVPFMAHVSRGIQAETGYSNYVHAFLTPPGEQGLRHHWDQQMAVIVQQAGVKRWELWRPPVDAPMREHLVSYREMTEEQRDRWIAAGPDQVVDLEVGQAMLLPRGWIHNPHNLGSGPSVHLTFAIRERTPFWVAEKLVERAIDNPAFRRVILPGDVAGVGLVDVVEQTRKELLAHLEGLDTAELAAELRELAGTELEYTT